MDDWTELKFNPNWMLPPIPAVYFLVKTGRHGFFDNVIELIYIGQTSNLNRRISQHEDWLNPGYYLGNEFFGEEQFDGVFYLSKMMSTDERLSIEYDFINQYFPKYNVNLPFSEGDRNEMKKYVEGWI